MKRLFGIIQIFTIVFSLAVESSAQSTTEKDRAKVKAKQRAKERAVRLLNAVSSAEKERNASFEASEKRARQAIKEREIKIQRLSFTEDEQEKVSSNSRKGPQSHSAEETRPLVELPLTEKEKEALRYVQSLAAAAAPKTPQTVTETAGAPAGSEVAKGSVPHLNVDQEIANFKNKGAQDPDQSDLEREVKEVEAVALDDEVSGQVEKQKQASSASGAESDYLPIPPAKRKVEPKIKTAARTSKGSTQTFASAEPVHKGPPSVVREPASVGSPKPLTRKKLAATSSAAR